MESEKTPALRKMYRIALPIYIAVFVVALFLPDRLSAWVLGILIGFTLGAELVEQAMKRDINRIIGNINKSLGKEGE